MKVKPFQGHRDPRKVEKPEYGMAAEDTKAVSKASLGETVSVATSKTRGIKLALSHRECV